MKVEIRHLVFVMCAVALLSAGRETVRGFAQPPTLESRVKLLEARIPGLVRPEGLVWAAAGSKETERELEFPAGNQDTAAVLQVKFPTGRFSVPPVVTATARWMNVHNDWIGGDKDSFAVTIFDLNADGFKALLRRVDRTNKPITAGVILDWIAVAETPKG